MNDDEPPPRRGVQTEAVRLLSPVAVREAARRREARRRRRMVLVVLAGIVVLAVALGVVWGLSGRDGGAAPGRTPTSEPVVPTESPTPTVPPAAAPPAASEALAALETLTVATTSSGPPYDRDLFGWRSVDHDRNGCDIRNDVLRRDLVDVEVRAGTNGCNVVSGELADPYTGSSIAFVVGGGASNDGGIQIDHVVSLSNAWASGADAWDSNTLLTFGNDPLNLLAVDGDANQTKGNGDAAEWLPDNTDYHCTYVARQVAVKDAYALTVTPDERRAMQRVLDSCPDQPLPSAADARTP